MSRPTFRPAPRPRPAQDGDEPARRLTEASRDLGFGRASTADDAPAASPSHDGPGVRTGKRPSAPDRKAVLKLDVPDAVYSALRQASLDRRVTVKYLVLEALAAKGYDVDLENEPVDGRRRRGS